MYLSSVFNWIRKDFKIMEARYYNRHSVLNIVDLIITGRDSEVYDILSELQKNSKTKRTTYRNPN